MVKANSNIFCSTPWYELHIYWDGSLGICCQESRKLYQDTDTQYNIACMTIKDWFNSDPVKQFRHSMLKDQRLAPCTRCYLEEDHGGNSRRLKSNQKSVIFTRTAFEHSFDQSPGHKHFELSAHQQGLTDTWPIDLHIDLGNFCNLACKMCRPQASSTIAAQEVKWGHENSRQYLGTDWTKNHEVWTRFKHELLELPALSNIHFMGGETLLTNRFEDLVDFFIEHEKFDVCFSFVTNGTVFREELIPKLAKFRRVGIEVSIETLTPHNAYQRQGTDTELVLKNIQKYQTFCNGTSITVALRPAPSLLTIGYYSTLLQFALTHRLIVKSNLVYHPRFLSAEILPKSVKKLYQAKYVDLLNSLSDVNVGTDYNASDPNNFQMAIKEQAQMCLSILQTATPSDSQLQLQAMVNHCQRWDRVYGLDAISLYPELEEIFTKYGYQLSS